MPYLRNALLLCGHGGLRRHKPPSLVSAIPTGGAFPFIKRAIVYANSFWQFSGQATMKVHKTLTYGRTEPPTTRCALS